MKLYKFLIFIFLTTFSIQTNAQMFGTLTLPGLGGGTNANAAVYAGDGVTIGAIGLFSSKLNPTVGAVSWNTGVEFLNGKYTVGIAQPVIFDGNFSSHIIPVTVISPLQLSWDLEQLKLQGNYSFMYGHDLPLNGHVFTVKATQYLYEQNYSLNGSLVYEYRHKKGDSDREFGDALVLEANFSKHFSKGRTLGLMGYYNSNISPEYFGDEAVLNDKSSIGGVGLDGGLPLGRHFFANGKFIYDLTKNESLKANKGVIALFYRF